jgi:hypothetical protein
VVLAEGVVLVQTLMHIALISTHCCCCQIVVDSIAALARKEGLNEDDKEKYVVRQAAAMKRVAELCNCVVLATNQVIPGSIGSNPSNSNEVNHAMNDAIQGFSIDYRPALGPTWHHCITSRFVLSQLRDYSTMAGIGMQLDGQASQSEHDADFSSNTARKIHLTKSPYLASFSKNFIINHRGFQVT